MKNFLFECTRGAHEGEEFIVQETSIGAAMLVAETVCDTWGYRFIAPMTNLEAELSGLDIF